MDEHQQGKWCQKLTFLGGNPMAFQWLREGFFLFASILLVLVLLKLLSKEKSRKRNLNIPPSPPKLPIIGNLHQLGDMPHLSLRRLAEKFGPVIHLQLGEIPTVVVSSAKLAKEVMKTHDLVLSSRPQIFSAKHLFYNCTDVVFSPYGAYWRHIRKICILELLSAKRVQSYSFVREEEVARLVHRIAESYPSTADLTKLLGLYANDVLCRVAFGRDFTEGGDYDRHGFQKMLEEYQVLLGGFSVGDFFPSMEFLHTLTQLHYMKAVVKEIFRLHPPAPVLVPRESMEEVTIDGYNIPFGAGRRSCPAITFGTATVELALAQLLHSFDWELPRLELLKCEAGTR